MKFTVIFLIALAGWFQAPNIHAGGPEQGVTKTEGRADAEPPTASKNKQATAAPEQPSAAPEINTVIDGNQTSSPSQRQSETQGWFNGLLVAVGLLQAIFVACTVWAINKQTETTKNSQRAWIIVDAMGLFLPNNFGTAIIWLPSPNVTNSGASPARITTMALNQILIPNGSSLPAVPNYGNEHVVWEIIQSPGQKFQPLNVAIVHSDIVMIMQGLGSLYLYGFVRYKDVWNYERETRFCFLYHHFMKAGDVQSGFYFEPTIPLIYTLCT